jgi:4-diphosphocytidyl-2-C-methyl-D-erythritol kinase
MRLQATDASQQSITCAAPAKINLFLRVVGRYRDGYHAIDSILLPLAWADKLTVSVQPSAPRQVTCHCPGHPELEVPSNLASRAAEVYLRRSGAEAGVHITLVKRIWIAAGLGGGSSDAAGVLKALNHLFDGAVPAPVLHELAAELGADVPFFLAARPARAWGRGDRLVLLPAAPCLPVVLANPGSPVSTRDVYLGLGLSPGTGAAETAPRARPPIAWQRLEGLILNDLAPVAKRLCPEVADLEHHLRRAGARAVGVTGSGPTVFGVYSNFPAAAAAAEQVLESTGFSVLATQTVGA